MTDGTLNIHVVLDNKVLNIPFNGNTTAEDVCISVCKQLGIGPVARHLFALRLLGKPIFLKSSANFGNKECIFDLRLRFKVASLAHLKKLDRVAYDYYFHQTRSDVVDNKIPYLYEKYRRELLGLGVADMYRVMLEKDLPRETVESDYKKYIPKEVIKHHMMFVKKPIHDALGRIKKAGHDAWYVKAEYLKQLEAMAPEYYVETYKAQMDQNGSIRNVSIKVLPHHCTEPGVKYCHEPNKEWVHLCSVQDLCFISVRKDGTVEISRKNGIPFYLKFDSLPAMFSFVSLLDGYYRLTCKWTFNLCKDVATPSLKRLYSMKCHGPVGGEFSYAKLEEKRCNHPGTFIIRESETKFNTYFIDVCTKDSLKPRTYKMEQFNDAEFIFNNDLTRYRSVAQLMTAYNDPEGEIYLKECLPPSEYDESPLLLCKSMEVEGDVLTDGSAAQELVSSAPICINSMNIQVYKDRTCLKWDKVRKRVRENGNFTRYEKFPAYQFPDQDRSVAKKSCRNPSGDRGGPWCFVKDEKIDEVEREYCEIPLCDEEDCVVFSQTSTLYSHHIAFDPKSTNFTFGLKIWDSDDYLNASARLLLSVLPLPVTGKNAEDLGVAVEIAISNNRTALTFGNRETPDYETTHDLIRSTAFTYFSLSWVKGFISLHKEGRVEPIFIAEYNTKKNLLGLRRSQFHSYSISGRDLLWRLPFCAYDMCAVHTTFALNFQQFWPLRESPTGHDLHVFIRAAHAAYILLTATPAIVYPQLKIILQKSNSTSLIATEYEGGPSVILREVNLHHVLDYWTWNEFALSRFSDTLQLYWVKDAKSHFMLEVKDRVVRTLRWYSPSSENTVAHWTFYCEPPKSANFPAALPPECSLKGNDPNYNGTQAVTSEAYPCLPWISAHVPEAERKVFRKRPLRALNYCRDPKKEQKGTYCYAVVDAWEFKVEKRMCHIRPCKSSDCKMSGTGNDYIGRRRQTRSNRTCEHWVPISNETQYQNATFGDNLYPDTSASKALDCCRNPTRTIAGAWCYTIDPEVPRDVCNVRDCDRPDDCFVVVKQSKEGQKKEGSGGVTILYRSMWRLAKGKKTEVAMKVLKQECCDRYFKEFLELAGQWAFLQSSAIVKLFGITLNSSVSMVMEYMRYGPLDIYLKENKSKLKLVDLIEASANLASALWHLEENGVIHGNIRCRRLFVSFHDENSFVVKLGDPGIHRAYLPDEVHWIPIEFYSNLEYARRSTSADVWAFATTLWEVFAFGETLKQANHFESMKFYASGKRLPQPPGCPNDIYQLMRECWDVDFHRRKKPQAIMRDINQILYQVYNSRRVHSYAKVSSERSSNIFRNLASGSSTHSLFSNKTDSTYLGSKTELISISDANQTDNNISLASNFMNGNLDQSWFIDNQETVNDDSFSCNFSTVFSNLNFSMATSLSSLNSISTMQSIFELDADCNVILQGRIGQGFYGEVFKGTLEYLGDKDCEPRQIAVKKLKTTAVSTCLQDFEREISIMKTLKHPNIVEILGVLQEPEISLVMEFVQHGSLQSYLKIHRDSLSTRQLLRYALDIAQGMDYLGQKHVVHRDLAARNILVVDENHVKISDFGLAQVMGSNEYYILKTNRELPIKWYASESLRDGKFSTRSDVWSYGVTMCEMFGHGEEPKLPMINNVKMEGQEQQALLNAIENGARFPCPPMCPQAIYVRIIYPCWNANPHERPLFFELSKEIEDLLTQY